MNVGLVHSTLVNQNANLTYKNKLHNVINLEVHPLLE